MEKRFFQIEHTISYKKRVSQEKRCRRPYLTVSIVKIISLPTTLPHHMAAGLWHLKAPKIPPVWFMRLPE
jgi:hypothetical protein